MKPIITLYEYEPASEQTLTPELATLYGGGLVISGEKSEERPYVIANFVETIDGIVSYNIPGKARAAVISGNKEQDKMVMGLLRAKADAVIFGAGSLLVDANHPRTPAYIYPQLAEEYQALRKELGYQEVLPISVIMTASGKLNMADKVFYTPGLRTVIATTSEGYNQLIQQNISPQVEIRVVARGETTRGSVSPKEVLKLLIQEYGVHIALYEGGPTLFSSFLAEHVIDELFLTLSPQIAGRMMNEHRLPLVEGYAFSPQDAPWVTLLSVKMAGDHLLLRYRFNWQEQT